LKENETGIMVNPIHGSVRYSKMYW